MDLLKASTTALVNGEAVAKVRFAVTGTTSDFPLSFRVLLARVTARFAMATDLEDTLRLILWKTKK
jgi:hypothetical protein